MIDDLIDDVIRARLSASGMTGQDVIVELLPAYRAFRRMSSGRAQVAAWRWLTDRLVADLTTDAHGDAVSLARELYRGGAGHDCDEWRGAGGVCEVCGAADWRPDPMAVNAALLTGPAPGESPIAHPAEIVSATESATESTTGRQLPKRDRRK